MKRIPKKLKPIVAGVLMAAMIGFIMSGIVTAVNLGIQSDFLELWMNAYIKVLPIAFFAVLLVRPLVEKLINKLFS